MPARGQIVIIRAISPSLKWCHTSRFRPESEASATSAWIPNVRPGKLTPNLISIERLGPIGVVELAERAGRDYTTVSRQVAKLEKLGLIIRQHNAIDRRIREAVISRTGKAMTERIDAAREQMGKVVFKDWPQDELDVFVRLMQKFADAMDSDASMPE